MSDHRQSAGKYEKPGSVKGNLGQKRAAREESADAKLEHMGDTQSSRDKRSKKHEERIKN